MEREGVTGEEPLERAENSTLGEHPVYSTVAEIRAAWEAALDVVPASPWPHGPLSPREALAAWQPVVSFAKGAKSPNGMPYELTHMHEIELREAGRHAAADAVAPARMAFWTAREARSRTTSI